MENGIVYLNGSMDQPTQGQREFANLPQAAWPTSTVFFPVYMFGDTTGTLAITCSGTMTAWNAPGQPNTASEYTSLAGISFPLAGSALTPIPLSSPWQSANTGYGTGDPSYLVRSGATMATSAPRSSNRLRSRCGSRMTVSPGTMTPASLRWPASPTRRPAPLGSRSPFRTAGQQQPTPPARPVLRCTTSAKASYLSGSVTSSQFSSSLIASLPAAAWPSHTLYRTVNTDTGRASLQITPTGQLTLFDSSAGTSWTSPSDSSF